MTERMSITLEDAKALENAEMVSEQESRERGVKIGKYGLTLYWAKTLQKWVTIPDAEA